MVALGKGMGVIVDTGAVGVSDDMTRTDSRVDDWLVAGAVDLGLDESAGGTDAVGVDEGGVAHATSNIGTRRTCKLRTSLMAKEYGWVGQSVLL
jgi:hypothetical protein